MPTGRRGQRPPGHPGLAGRGEYLRRPPEHRDYYRRVRRRCPLRRAGGRYRAGRRRPRRRLRRAHHRRGILPAHRSRARGRPARHGSARAGAPDRRPGPDRDRPARDGHGGSRHRPRPGPRLPARKPRAQHSRSATRTPATSSGRPRSRFSSATRPPRSNSAAVPSAASSGAVTACGSASSFHDRRHARHHPARHRRDHRGRRRNLPGRVDGVGSADQPDSDGSPRRGARRVLRARGVGMDFDQALAYTLTQTTQALNDLQPETQPSASRPPGRSRLAGAGARRPRQQICRSSFSGLGSLLVHFFRV